MYEELVKALRWCVLSNPCDGCPYYDQNGPTEKCATMNVAAADAIEELSSLVNHYGGETGIKNLQEYANKYWDLLKNAPRWIPVTQQLPNKSGRYLTVLEENGIQHMYVAIFQNKFNLPAGKMSHWKVTHWMPLPSAPEPPKEET